MINELLSLLFAFLALHHFANWRRHALHDELRELLDYMQGWHPGDGSTYEECAATADQLLRSIDRCLAVELLGAVAVCVWVIVYISGAWQ